MTRPSRILPGVFLVLLAAAVRVRAAAGGHQSGRRAGGSRSEGQRRGRQEAAGREPWPALGSDRERLLRGLPRQGRSRRGSRSGWPGRAPTPPGRPARTALSLHQRPHFDRAAHASRGNPRRQLERPIEVVRLEQVEAAENLLRVRERPVRRQRPPVVHANGRRAFRRLSCSAPRTPGSCISASYSPWIDCRSSSDIRSYSSIDRPG